MSVNPAPLHHRRRPLHHRRTPLHRLRAPAVVAVGLLATIVIVLAAAGDLSDSGPPAGTGSGQAATQTRTVAPFTGVELAGANNVTVRVGPRQSVVVHADTNLLGRVTTTVRSKILEIGTAPGNLSARTPMFVEVTVPAIDRIVLHGSGNLAVTGIDARTLAIELPGSGTISASGTTARLAVALDGSGTVLLGQLSAGDVAAALRGDGTITLLATRSLDASVSGTGTILFSGHPAHLATSVTGQGAVVPTG